MEIDLKQQIAAAEKLLSGLRELDGTVIDDNARGRAARSQRAALSRRLQALAHQSDVIRVNLTGTQMAIRDPDGEDAAGEVS